MTRIRYHVVAILWLFIIIDCNALVPVPRTVRLFSSVSRTNHIPIDESSISLDIETSIKQRQACKRFKRFDGLDTSETVASISNPEIVKDVQLYKSTIPENFGGRLASVLEVTNRDGDKHKIIGSAGIGLITSRFNIEGPIDSGRTSFIFGARGTYSNWLLKLLPEAYKNSRASFYDTNLGISHKIVLIIVRQGTLQNFFLFRTI